VRGVQVFHSRKYVRDLVANFDGGREIGCYVQEVGTRSSSFRRETPF